MCGGVENTMHLLFECPEYSEIAWEGLKEVLNIISETNNIIVHSLNVMYIQHEYQKFTRKNAKTNTDANSGV